MASNQNNLDIFLKIRTDNSGLEQTLRELGKTKNGAADLATKLDQYAKKYGLTMESLYDGIDKFNKQNKNKIGFEPIKLAGVKGQISDLNLINKNLVAFQNTISKTALTAKQQERAIADYSQELTRLRYASEKIVPFNSADYLGGLQSARGQKPTQGANAGKSVTTKRPGTVPQLAGTAPDVARVEMSKYNQQLVKYQLETLEASELIKDDYNGIEEFARATLAREAKIAELKTELEKADADVLEAVKAQERIQKEKADVQGERQDVLKRALELETKSTKLSASEANLLVSTNKEYADQLNSLRSRSTTISALEEVIKASEAEYRRMSGNSKNPKNPEDTEAGKKLGADLRALQAQRKAEIDAQIATQRRITKIEQDYLDSFTQTVQLSEQQKAGVEASSKSYKSIVALEKAYMDALRPLQGKLGFMESQLLRSIADNKKKLMESGKMPSISVRDSNGMESLIPDPNAKYTLSKDELRRAEAIKKLQDTYNEQQAKLVAIANQRIKIEESYINKEKTGKGKVEGNTQKMAQKYEKDLQNFLSSESDNIRLSADIVAATIADLGEDFSATYKKIVERAARSMEFFLTTNQELSAEDLTSKLEAMRKGLETRIQNAFSGGKTLGYPNAEEAILSRSAQIATLSAQDVVSPADEAKIAKLEAQISEIERIQAEDLPHIQKIEQLHQQIYDLTAQITRVNTAIAKVEEERKRLVEAEFKAQQEKVKFVESGSKDAEKEAYLNARIRAFAEQRQKMDKSIRAGKGHVTALENERAGVGQVIGTVYEAYGRTSQKANISAMITEINDAAVALNKFGTMNQTAPKNIEEARAALERLYDAIFQYESAGGNRPVEKLKFGKSGGDDIQSIIFRAQEGLFEQQFKEIAAGTRKGLSTSDMEAEIVRRRVEEAQRKEEASKRISTLTQEEYDAIVASILDLQNISDRATTLAKNIEVRGTGLEATPVNTKVDIGVQAPSARTTLKQNSITKLQQKIEELNQLIAQRSAEISSLKTTDYSAMKLKPEAIDILNAKRDKNIESKEKKIAGYEKEIQKNMQSISELEAQIAKATGQQLAATKDTTKKEKDKTSAKEKTTQAEKQVLSATAQELQSQLQSHKDTVSAYTSLKKEAEQKIEELKKPLDKKSLTKEGATKIAEGREKKVRNLTKQAEEFDAKIAKSVSAIADLEQQLTVILQGEVTSEEEVASSRKKRAAKAKAGQAQTLEPVTPEAPAKAEVSAIQKQLNDLVVKFRQLDNQGDANAKANTKPALDALLEIERLLETTDTGTLSEDTQKFAGKIDAYKKRITGKLAKWSGSQAQAPATAVPAVVPEGMSDEQVKVAQQLLKEMQEVADNTSQMVEDTEPTKRKARASAPDDCCDDIIKALEKVDKSVKEVTKAIREKFKATAKVAKADTTLVEEGTAPIATKSKRKSTRSMAKELGLDPNAPEYVNNPEGFKNAIKYLMEINAIKERLVALDVREAEEQAKILDIEQKRKAALDKADMDTYNNLGGDLVKQQEEMNKARLAEATLRSKLARLEEAQNRKNQDRQDRETANPVIREMRNLRALRKEQEQYAKDVTGTEDRRVKEIARNFRIRLDNERRLRKEQEQTAKEITGTENRRVREVARNFRIQLENQKRLRKEQEEQARDIVGTENRRVRETANPVIQEMRNLKALRKEQEQYARDVTGTENRRAREAANRFIREMQNQRALRREQEQQARETVGTENRRVRETANPIIQDMRNQRALRKEQEQTAKEIVGTENRRIREVTRNFRIQMENQRRLRKEQEQHAKEVTGTQARQLKEERRIAETRGGGLAQATQALQQYAAEFARISALRPADQVRPLAQIIDQLERGGFTGMKDLSAMLRRDFGVTEETFKRANKEVRNMRNGFTGMLKEAFNLGSIINTLFGVNMAMIVFQLQQMISNVFRSAVEEAKKLEQSISALSAAEEIMSVEGIQVTGKDLLDIVTELETRWKNISHVDLLASTGSLALRLADQDIDPETLKKLMDAALGAKTKNPDKSLEDIIGTMIGAITSSELVGARTIGFTALTADNIKKEAVRLKLIEDENQALTDQQERMAKISIILKTQETQQDSLLNMQDNLSNASSKLGKSWADFLELFKPVVDNWNQFLLFISYLLDQFVLLNEWVVSVQKQSSEMVKNFTDSIPILKQIGDYLEENRKKNAEFWGGPAFAKNLFYGQSTGPTEENLLKKDTPTGPKKAISDENASGTESNSSKIIKWINNVRDALIDFSARAKKAQEDFNLSMRRMTAEFSLEYKRFLQDWAREKREAVRDSNKAIADKEKEYQKQSKDDYAAYLEQLRQLREQYLMSLEDALHERDARAVLKLMRDYAVNKQNITNEYENRKQQGAIQHQEEIARMKQEAADRLKEIDAERALARARMIEDYEIKKKMAIEDHQREMKELERERKEKMRELAQAFSEEFGLNQKGADAIYQLLDGYFGEGGGVDILMQYTYSNTVRYMGEMMKKLLQFQKDYKWIISDINKTKVEDQAGPTTASGPAGGASTTSGNFSASMFLPTGYLSTLSGVSNTTGLRTNKDGKMELMVTLSPDLETRIVKKSSEQTANAIMQVRRAR